MGTERPTRLEQLVAAGRGLAGQRRTTSPAAVRAVAGRIHHMTNPT
jgi:hypothetical protein